MIRSFSLCLLLIPVLLSGCAALQKSSAGTAEQRRMDAAYRFMAEGNYRRAADLFDQILVKEPENDRALYGSGSVCLFQGRYSEATLAFKQSVPEIATAQAYNRWAVAEAMNGYYQGAVALMDKSLQLKPGHTGLRLNKAVIQAVYGAPDEAEATVAELESSGLERWDRRVILIHVLTGRTPALKELPDSLRDVRSAAEKVAAVKPARQRARYLGLNLLQTAQEGDSEAAVAEAQ